MKFGIVTTLWKRPAITRMCLRRMRRACADRAVLMAVCSGAEMRNLALQEGWEVATCENQPLGNKFNEGYRQLRGRVDAVMLTGSDTWLSNDCLDGYETSMGETPFLGLLDHYFIDTRSGKCLYFRYAGDKTGYSLGDGRMLRADILDKLDWAPVDSKLPRALDWSMTLKLNAVMGEDAVKACPVVPMQELGITVCSFKSETNLNTFRTIDVDRGSTESSISDVAVRFPDDEVEHMRSLFGI